MAMCNYKRGMPTVYNVEPEVGTGQEWKSSNDLQS